MLAILLLIFFLGTPIALTIYNFLILFKNTENKRRRNFLWLTTIVLGVFFSKVLLEMGDVLFDAMWNKQIYSNQTHQPIWTGALLTVFMHFIDVFKHSCTDCMDHSMLISRWTYFSGSFTCAFKYIFNSDHDN